MEKRPERKMDVTFDKWNQAQADAGQNKAHGDEFRFAHLFDHPADRATLHEGSDQTAIDEEVRDGSDSSFIDGIFLWNPGRRIFADPILVVRPGFAGEIEMKIVADHQRQGALEATETKRGQKKHDDEQANFGLGERVLP